MLKAGREREAGGPGSSQGLKSGSARGSGDPWAQAQLQRHVDTWHSHTQTHSRGYTCRNVADTCVFVWAHAQTCSSSHSHISKNTQMDLCEYTHRHVRVHRDTHVVTNSQICFNAPWVGSGIHTCPRHTQIHKCTHVPMWDGMQRRARTHGDWCGHARLDSLRYSLAQRSAQRTGAHA